MSYKSDLQQNNADLQAVLNDVNDLPDAFIPTGTKNITENGTHDVKSYASVNVNVAGSGGGVPTCTVQINAPQGIVNVINYTGLEDGKPVWKRLIQPYDATITLTVVCGSVVHIMFGRMMTMALSNASIVYNLPEDSLKIFAATNNESEISIATFEPYIN